MTNLTPPRLLIAVRGLPVAQGSARAFMAGGRAHIATGAHDIRSPLAHWRSSIATEARAVMGDAPALDGPVSLEVRFVMPRPKSHYNRLGVRADAPCYHTAKPDVDKLLRSVLDAISVVVIRDDSQVAILASSKAYEDVGHPVGVTIELSQLPVTG